MSSATPAALKDHFEGHGMNTHTGRWEDLWTAKNTPWDRDGPSPALIDLLDATQDLPRSSEGGRRLRALVPGCGSGYDVTLLASHGYDALGVDASATAVQHATASSASRLDRPEYAVRNEAIGRGAVKFVAGDFFDDQWWASEGSKEGFDIIYDYTFLCALPPAIRPKWAARMSQLLSPTGRLICLEFPTYKARDQGGPPWAVRPLDYVAYLSKPGQPVTLDRDVVQGVDEESPARSTDGLVRTVHFQPKRSHQIGQGTDWISIWRHQT